MPKILCYKITRGLVLLSPDSFFTFVCNSRTRGHSFKLFYRIQGLIVDSIFRCSCAENLELSVRKRCFGCSFVVVYLSFGTSKFKSVSGRQDVGALMCSVFTYLDLHYYLYICILYSFYLAAFKRHYALRLAIAPEFFYVCALGC